MTTRLIPSIPRNSDNRRVEISWEGFQHNLSINLSTQRRVRLNDSTRSIAESIKLSTTELLKAENGTRS